MEKCIYHDELVSLVKEIRDEVGEIKETQASSNTTLKLLVDGRLKFNGGSKNSTEKPDKVALAALEIAKIAISALAGGSIAGLWVRGGPPVLNILAAIFRGIGR